MFRGFPPTPPWARSLTSVGVTGTNGKTTTTRWLAAILRSLGHPVLCVTTVGGFLDDESLGVMDSHAAFVAWARMAMQRGARFAAIETTSEALGLGFAKAWPLRVGVFTNLSQDHLDAHRTPEHYLASKAQLFVHLPVGGAAVLNADDDVAPLLREVIPEGVSVVSYSRAKGVSDALVHAGDIHVGWSGTTATLSVRAASVDTPLATFPLSLPAVGEVYVDNAMAALCAAYQLGVPWEQGARALVRAPLVPGRFEVVHEHPHVVVDYAHTPQALKQVLQTARALCEGHLTVVFGAGGNRDRSKREPMGIAARAADRVVITSDNPRNEPPEAIAQEIARGLAGREVQIVLDRPAAIAQALGRAGANDVVVIAGKGHETTQTVRGATVPMGDVSLVQRWFAG